MSTNSLDEEKWPIGLERKTASWSWWRSLWWSLLTSFQIFFELQDTLLELQDTLLVLQCTLLKLQCTFFKLFVSLKERETALTGQWKYVRTFVFGSLGFQLIRYWGRIDLQPGWGFERILDSSRKLYQRPIPRIYLSLGELLISRKINSPFIIIYTYSHNKR